MGQKQQTSMAIGICYRKNLQDKLNTTAKVSKSLVSLLDNQHERGGQRYPVSSEAPKDKDKTLG